MNRRLLTLLAVSTLFAHTLRSADTKLPDEIDRYLTARTSLGQFSGVALVATADGIVFRKAYGYANLELRVPTSVDTTFEIASISKAFTAAAILSCATKGAFNSMTRSAGSPSRVRRSGSQSPFDNFFTTPRGSLTTRMHWRWDRRHTATRWRCRTRRGG